MDPPRPAPEMDPRKSMGQRLRFCESHIVNGILQIDDSGLHIARIPDFAKSLHDDTSRDYSVERIMQDWTKVLNRTHFWWERSGSGLDCLDLLCRLLFGSSGEISSSAFRSRIERNDKFIAYDKLTMTR